MVRKNRGLKILASVHRAAATPVGSKHQRPEAAEAASQPASHEQGHRLLLPRDASRACSASSAGCGRRHLRRFGRGGELLLRIDVMCRESIEPAQLPRYLGVSDPVQLPGAVLFQTAGPMVPIRATSPTSPPLRAFGGEHHRLSYHTAEL
jgi:hypothetical protein